MRIPANILEWEFALWLASRSLIESLQFGLIVRQNVSIKEDRVEVPF